MLICCARVDPKEHSVLMSDNLLANKIDRKRMAQIVLEGLGAPGFYVARTAALALYSAGRTNGAVLDMGGSVAHAVVVSEGYALPQTILPMDLSGHLVTTRLADLLKEAGRAVSDVEVVRAIKEKLCYVAEDFAKERAKPKGQIEADFKLPDGQMLKVGLERFTCTEALFQPHQMRRKDGGVHEGLYKSIMKANVDVRGEMFKNIVLCGGTSMLPNMPGRLQKGVSTLAPPTIKVDVTGQKDHEFSVWKGGAALASLPSFSGAWVTKAEYAEQGASILHRKCF